MQRTTQNMSKLSSDIALAPYGAIVNSNATVKTIEQQLPLPAFTCLKFKGGNTRTFC